MNNKLGFPKKKFGLKRGCFENKFGLNTKNKLGLKRVYFKNKLGFEKSSFLK